MSLLEYGQGVQLFFNRGRSTARNGITTVFDKANLTGSANLDSKDSSSKNWDVGPNTGAEDIIYFLDFKIYIFLGGRYFGQIDCIAENL